MFSYLAEEHAKLREDVAKFVVRQMELKAKLVAVKAAEEKVGYLKGQLAMEHTWQKQRRTPKLKQVEAEKKSSSGLQGGYHCLLWGTPAQEAKGGETCRDWFIKRI